MEDEQNVTEPILLKSLLADLDIRCFSLLFHEFFLNSEIDSVKTSGRNFYFYWIRLHSVFLDFEK